MIDRPKFHISEECRASLVAMFEEDQLALCSVLDNINQQSPERWAPSEEHARHLGRIANINGKLQYAQEVVARLRSDEASES